MARPKNLWRERKKSRGEIGPGKIKSRPKYLGGWVGEHESSDDADLPPDLREILTEERAIRSFKRPPFGDIRHSLREAAKLEGDDLRKAVRALSGGWTGCWLTTGALQWHRQHFEGTLPDGWDDIGKQPEAVIREMIEQAISSLPKEGGRRPSINRDAEFAVRLMGYWERKHGRATVSVLGGAFTEIHSAFLAFAKDCFLRIGRGIASPSKGLRPLAPATMKEILQVARRRKSLR